MIEKEMKDTTIFFLSTNHPWIIICLLYPFPVQSALQRLSHSPIQTHIHTLIAEVAMQGAGLLSRSNVLKDTSSRSRGSRGIKPDLLYILSHSLFVWSFLFTSRETEPQITLM